MSKRRYLVIIINCFIFGPAFGYGVEFECFVGPPSEPYYTFLLCLDLLLNHNCFFLFRLNNFLKFGLTYEMSNTSRKVSHGFEIYLEVVSWKPKLLINIEPLFFPRCIYRLKIHVKFTKSFPFAHHSFIYFFLDRKDEILEISYVF